MSFFEIKNTRQQTVESPSKGPWKDLSRSGIKMAGYRENVSAA